MNRKMRISNEGALTENDALELTRFFEENKFDDKLRRSVLEEIRNRPRSRIWFDDSIVIIGPRKFTKEETKKALRILRRLTRTFPHVDNYMIKHLLKQVKERQASEAHFGIGLEGLVG